MLNIIQNTFRNYIFVIDKKGFLKQTLYKAYGDFQNFDDRNKNCHHCACSEHAQICINSAIYCWRAIPGSENWTEAKSYCDGLKPIVYW